MRTSAVLHFQHSATASLRRPWQTFRDGQIFYGITKTGSKRHPLTTKEGNKHFYKGTRSTGYGRLNKAGQYIVDWLKVRTYVVPADLSSTPLRPLVSSNTPQVRQTFEGYTDGFKDPQLAWDNIKDFIEYGENYNDIDLEKSDFHEKFVSPASQQLPNSNA